MISTMTTDIARVVFNFAVFGVFHSIGASERFKKALSILFSPFFVDYFYRFIYCLISWYLLYDLFLAQLFQTAQHGNWPFFYLPVWVNLTRCIIGLVGVTITYVAFIQFDYLEFLGIKQ